VGQLADDLLHVNRWQRIRLDIFLLIIRKAVLELPIVSPGVSGVAFITADEMALWTPPADPPEARHLQELAIVIKRAAESGSLAKTAATDAKTLKQPLENTPVRVAVGGSFDPESLVPELQKWFDDFIEPGLISAQGGCNSAADVFKSTAQWTQAVQEYFLLDSAGLSGRLNAVEQALDTMNSTSNDDIREFDKACSEITDPCKQIEVMLQAAVCSQVLQSAGFESSNAMLACKDAPAQLAVQPVFAKVCTGANINFSAVVKSFNGATVPVQQVGLRWSSQSPNLLSVDPESGVGEALKEGHPLVDAESEVCGAVLGGTTLVQIEDVPDILGDFSVEGSETVSDCEFDGDNGTSSGSGTVTITLQSQGDSPDSEKFAGVGTGLSLGENFDGTVRCGGAVSGTGSFTEMEPCGENGEDTCVTSGTTTFTGSLIGNTLKVDTTSQDTSGDTCYAEGWAKATRAQNP